MKRNPGAVINLKLGDESLGNCWKDRLAFFRSSIEKMWPNDIAKWEVEFALSIKEVLRNVQ